MALRTSLRRNRPAGDRTGIGPADAVPLAVDSGASAPRADLRWVDLDAADASAHPTILGDIAARRLDGMTVTGIFTADEAARAVARLEALHDERYPGIFGSILGTSLADLSRISADPHDRGPYLDEAAITADRMVDAFGFDPFARLAGILTPMAGGLTVTTPQEGGRPYPPANVRWMEPGGGGLPAHVGNEFQVHSDGATDHLRKVTHVLDHYSWFIILQTPTDGGALSVFDLLYETHTPDPDQWGTTGRADDAFDRVPALRLAPPAGTLVMFGGGWRWHRVDKVGGTRPRITYGGFAGPSTDGRELHLWF
jgi:hypothetical protein